LQFGLGPQPLWGTYSISPETLAGEEGAQCLLPITPPLLSAFGLKFRPSRPHECPPQVKLLTTPTTTTTTINAAAATFKFHLTRQFLGDFWQCFQQSKMNERWPADRACNLDKALSQRFVEVYFSGTSLSWYNSRK